MNKISILLTSISIFLSYPIAAQFSKIIKDAINLELWLLIGENNQIVFPTSVSDDVKFTKLDSNGEVIWVKILDSPDNHRFINNRNNGFYITDTGEVISQSDSYDNLTNRYSLNFMETNGDLRWSKYVRLDENTSIALNQDYQTKILKHKNRIFVAGKFFITDLNDEIYSIASFDEMGNLKSHAEFKDLDIEYDIFISALMDSFVLILSPKKYLSNSSKIIIFNNDLKIIGTYETPLYLKKLEQIDERIYALGSHNFNPAFVSLNNNFEVLRGTSIVTNSRRPMKVFSSITEDGIIFKFPDEVVVSDIFSLISVEGDLKNSWRIPKLGSLISTPMFASNDKVLYLAYASSVQNEGALFFYASHDPNFEEFGCYIPTTCIETQSFSPRFIPIPNPLEQINLEIVVEDTNFSMRDGEVTTIDFCPDDFSSIASPFFVTDDTVCTNTSVQVYNIQNENASLVNWQLEGSSLQSTDTKVPSSFTYPEAGTYTITQEIVFEGCLNSFSTEIVVVSPVPHELPSTVISCEDDALLNASTDGAISYEWNDNSTDTSLLVSEEGIYTVEISDKNCTQAHTFQFDFFDFDFIAPLFESDTVICEQKPLIIASLLDPSVDFEWSDSFPTLDRAISQTGIYTLTTSIGECSLTSSIFVQAEDCSTQLYIPNAFTPNLDGINDTFAPLGNFFEVLDFKIYDRWGNTVHDAILGWDGKFRNKSAAVGVYNYILKVKNTLLDTEELHSGNVSLIK